MCRCLKNVKVAKGTYGGVAELLDDLARRARTDGGDAIINYAGSRRFGFFPWRLVHPVVRGESIKSTGAAPKCEQAGGSTLQTIISCNKGTWPGRQTACA